MHCIIGSYMQIGGSASRGLMIPTYIFTPHSVVWERERRGRSPRKRW